MLRIDVEHRCTEDADQKEAENSAAVRARPVDQRRLAKVQENCPGLEAFWVASYPALAV